MHVVYIHTCIIMYVCDVWQLQEHNDELRSGMVGGVCDWEGEREALMNSNRLDQLGLFFTNSAHFFYQLRPPFFDQLRHFFNQFRPFVTNSGRFY